MSIRAKLLFLLLLTALAPLLFVSLYDRRGMQRLGGTLAASAKQSLLDRTAEQLEHLIREQARQLRERLAGLEQTLRAQARAVEARLAAAAPEFAARRYYAQDYDRGIDVPADLKPSDRHFRFNAAGEGAPIPVSYTAQVYKLAPGVDPAVVASDIARLSTLPVEYGFLRAAHPELIFWQVTALESGIHTSFPGHGGYADEYDPREREWYVRAVERDAPSWIGPYVDATSLQLILTVSAPVRRATGEIAGVTGLDVSVADIVESMRLPDTWTRDARSILVQLREDERGVARPAIIAQPGYHRRDEPWNARIDATWLESDTAGGVERLVADLQAGRYATQQLGFAGRECLWVYGPVEAARSHLVLILPHDEVVAQAVAAEREIQDETAAHLRGTGLIALLVVAAIVLVAVIGSRTVTQPVRQLAETAERIAKGDFNARVDIRTRDELGTLGERFNAMVPHLEDRMKLRHSLSLAMEVQQHLLPAAAPRVDGLDVAGKSIYCDETGGDYYDFLELADLGPNRLGLAIGDVTGHGIAAALLMTTARALLRSHASHTAGLDEMMNGLNRYLAADMTSGRFMTMFYLMLDAQTRQAWWASAGHDPAIVYDPASDGFSDLPGADIPLGIEPSWKYAERGPVELRVGQVIVIGTDGIWESRNGADEFFGKDKLRDVMRRNAQRSAADIGHAITEELTRFRKEHPQEDDVTMVVIKVTKRSDESDATDVGHGI